MQISKQQLILFLVIDTLLMVAIVLGFLWYQHQESERPAAPSSVSAVEAR